MLRGIRLTVGLLLVLGAVGAGGVALLYLAAHRGIDALEPALPTPAQIAALADAPDAPLALWWINTASQTMPRSLVLEPSLDPAPNEPYRMSHPSFVLEWADGRLFLIDAGLTASGAADFGAPAELVGAEPIEFHEATAAALGAAARRVGGIAFTHLHQDHTGGLPALCEARGSAPLPVFQTRLQADQGNFTTIPGRAALDAAPCAAVHVLEESTLRTVPGFPGIGVIAAAGHTPGSQVLVAAVRGEDSTRIWLFTGDVVNHVEGVRRDLPKPIWYSRFVVPESPARLGVVRRHLRDWVARVPAALLVSHHQGQIEATALPAWRPSPP